MDNVMESVLMGGSSVLTDLELTDAMIPTITGHAAMVIVNSRVHHVMMMEQKLAPLDIASVEVESLVSKIMTGGIVMVIVLTRTTHVKLMEQKHAPLDITSVVLIDA